MFQYPQNSDDKQQQGFTGVQPQTGMMDPSQNLSCSPLSTSPLESPLSTSPRMTLSPQPSMMFDTSNIQAGSLPMNNFILAGTPQSPNFALQNPGYQSLMINPNQNNLQVQLLQQQIQQLQLQLQMLQQPQMSTNQQLLQQLQMQIQLLQQQQQPGVGMGSLSVGPTTVQTQLTNGSVPGTNDSATSSPTNPNGQHERTIHRSVSTIVPNDKSQGGGSVNDNSPRVNSLPCNYGVAGSYVTQNLLSQVEIMKIVEDIKDAIASASMDTSKLVNILGRYPPVHMNQISSFYKSLYKQNLESAVKGVTSGNFGKLCTALTKTVLDYDVCCIREAIKGLGTDDDCLIDILVGRTNVDLIAMNKAYKETFNKSLEDDVRGDTSGDYRTALVSLLQGNRNETNIQRDVESDVDALYKAGEGKVGTNETTFITILTNRSYSHLRQVFDKYQQKYSHSMEKAINGEFSGNIKKTLLGIVRTTTDLSQYIAEQFENSMKGMGTRNDKLIRLVVRYREPALMQRIKEDYVKLYGKTLAKRIEGETSGDYRKLLLMCIGEL